MDFTEIYKQSANIVSFSPGAHFILNAVEDVLVVRRTDTLQITRTWPITSSPHTATDPDHSISHAGWSCDSEYLFAASAKTAIVQVFKLRDETWTAHIQAGAEGLVKAEWAPDGRNILCFSEWGVSTLALHRLPMHTAPVTAPHYYLVHRVRNRHIYSIPRSS